MNVYSRLYLLGFELALKCNIVCSIILYVLPYRYLIIVCFSCLIFEEKITNHLIPSCG